MKTLIAKQGFITRLYAACNNGLTPKLGNFNDRAECYDFPTLLSERTGEEHNEIVVVAGAHCIEKTTHNRFVVWFMNNEEAEPWNSCKSLAEAMDELKELEQLTVS